MKARARRFVPLVAAAALLGAVGYGAVALASVDLSAGIRYVSATGTADECSTKAKAALEVYLPGATETSPGSGEWIATAQNPVVGVPTAAATVRCYGLSKGYVATFICSVQLPTNPYAATPLCLNIAHKILRRRHHAARGDADADASSQRLLHQQSRGHVGLRRQSQ